MSWGAAITLSIIIAVVGIVKLMWQKNKIYFQQVNESEDNSFKFEDDLFKKDITKDITTNPAFSDFSCNIYHHIIKDD